MELEALQQKWFEHDRKLDVSIRLNQQLLSVVKMNGLRFPLRRFAALLGLGALIGLFGIIVLGHFIYQHVAEPRFALPALALDIWMIATMAASIRQIAMALQISYDNPVTVIQKQLESLRVLRIRIIQCALLTGQLVWWIPFLITALKAFWDVDAYKVFSNGFLLANLGICVAFIPLAIWLSKNFATRIGNSWIMPTLMREVTGYNLNAAYNFLAALSEFESQ